jgi:hypothetical protein
MRDAQPWQVKLFLFQFKEFAQKKFSFAERDTSLDTIARLGITIQQAKNEILGLTYEDYYRGPISDADSKKGGEYWEFGKLISGQEIFIKLKTVSEYYAAICFSFHIPERKIEYPFKRREERK